MAIIPAAAAAIIALVTWLSPEIPSWKRWLVIGLTVITIGAISINQWWEAHEKYVRDTRRTEILETLGQFISEGDGLVRIIVSSGNEAIPRDKIIDWENRAEKFLNTLGPSYVIRFKSGAGLETNLSPNGVDETHAGFWRSLRVFLTRLHEFSAEFSGQIHSPTSSNSF